MVDRCAVENIANISGLEIDTCENLLKQGWVFRQNIGEPDRWETPGIRVAARDTTPNKSSFKEELIAALKTILDETNYAIIQIKRDNPGDPYRLRYRDGTYILASVLTARANAMAALANLTE